MPTAQRNRFCLYMLVIVFAQLLACEVPAQTYPNKPVHILVGSAAGGGGDTTARLLAQQLSQPLGQQVVVENRPGAGGSIANERVAKSPADGYTLLMITSSVVVLPALRTNLPYDLERDFTPVSLVAMSSMVLVVHSAVPARTVKELIALARSQPDKLNYGSGGIGTAPHLAGELFSLMAKVRLVHVPYKGGAEAAKAAAAGEIQMTFPGVTSILPLIEAGRVRALAVTGAKRSSFMPSIPTLDESGLPGYDYSAWFGLLAPAAVPKNIIVQLNMAIAKAVDTPEMKEALHKQGLEPQTNSPEQFAAFMRSELAQAAKLAKLARVEAK